MAYRKVNYVNGVTAPVMKKIAQFWFGEPAILGLKKDSTEFNFVLILDKKAGIEDWQIAKFKKFWQIRITIAE